MVSSNCRELCVHIVQYWNDPVLDHASSLPALFDTSDLPKVAKRASTTDASLYTPSKRRSMTLQGRTTRDDYILEKREYDLEEVGDLPGMG